MRESYFFVGSFPISCKSAAYLSQSPPLFSDTPLSTSKVCSKQNSLSKDYLNLVLLSVKITNLISSDDSLSYLKYKKVIKFPYSNLITNKNTYNIKNQKNKVIPIKKIQNN